MFSRYYCGHLLTACCGILWLILSFKVHTLHGHPISTGSARGGLFDWKTLDDINLDGMRYAGEWYILDCRLEDYTINVSLWRGVDYPDNEVNQKYITLSNQTFNITNVTYQDSTSYFCRAKGRKDKSLGYLKVSVGGKAFQTPNIINGNEINGKEINAKAGDTVSLVCEVEGWYAMRWYSNNNHNLPHKDISFWKSNYIRITRERLEIKNVTEQDSGSYTCKVERFVVGWKATNSIQVKVQAMARNTDIPNKNTTTILK